jgi:hypothetical protein
MKSLSSLPKGFLSSYLKNQLPEVRDNAHKALGLSPLSRLFQLAEYQSVTKSQKENQTLNPAA